MDVLRERGRNLRTREAVSVGIPPVDESTGEGAGKGGDGGRAKGTMQVRDKACKGKARESEVG
jgi:hypothetical protein